MAKRHTWIQNIGRLLKLKLLVPLWRSPHPPEYKALGVAIGTMWAMTPLVGVQMWLVFMTWAFAKRVLKKPFSLPLGLAYTWLTNVFTMIPIYYVFYVTGQMMMCHWDSISGYSHLKQILEQTFLSDLSFADEWLLFFKLLLKDWGVAMLVGSIPWMIGGFYFGYRLTMKYELMRQRQKAAKLAKNAAGPS